VEVFKVFSTEAKAFNHEKFSENQKKLNYLEVLKNNLRIKKVLLF
jgi:hypothetical protein